MCGLSRWMRLSGTSFPLRLHNLIKMADALLKEDDDGQKDRTLPQE